MRFPVTFKQQDIVDIIEDWIENEYGVTPERRDGSGGLNADDNDADDVFNKKTEFVFSQSTWYGMIIDTLITVQECT